MIRVCFALLWVTPLFAQKAVHYQLHFQNAAHHEALIEATFTGATEPTLHVLMSRSSPGRYALHEFAKNLYDFCAFDAAGQPLAITRSDPYSWQIEGVHGTVRVRYTLYANYSDGTYAAIDTSHAHLNIPATLVWARGFEQAPATVSFDIPPGLGWQVATELLPQSDNTWSAPNLEMLMDGPVELSKHAFPEWKIEDATFRLSLHHRGTDEEAAAFAEMCKAVVLEEEGVFGSLPKYDGGTYTFLIDYLPYVIPDGMEHRDSTVITGTHDLKEAASREIGTVSHEFFHSWNVRRIRPRSLEPFDFERVNMSGELWFAEGFTNYYGILALERAGFSTLDQFAGSMGPAVNAVLTAPGRNVHSIVEMSRLAGFVDAARSIDPTDFDNTFISYYTYGQALAFGIDLAIREQFPGKSLDDWMRTMWREHPDIDRPYTLEDLQSTLAETTGSADFARDLFTKHIYGKESLNYADLIAPAGLLLRKAHPGKVWLGARKLNFTDDGVEIGANTLRDSPLYNAGLDMGDKIQRWKGQPAKTLNDLEEFLKKQKPGDSAGLEVTRRGQPATVTLVFAEDPSLEIVTYESAGMPVTAAMKQLRDAWLKSKALHPLPAIPVMP